MASNTDVLIVGGGLAGCLMALKLSVARPELKIQLIESAERLGGAQTWGFRATDIPAEAMEWIEPLLEKSWTNSQVRFPKLDRTLSASYHTMRSENLHKHLLKVLGQGVRLKSKVARITDSEVTLENGKKISASCVLDTRGFTGAPSAKVSGYQKFIGFDCELETPHDLTTPIVVDATCPQLDGFRYFSLLPWDETRILVKETFYSDSPDLNLERITKSIRSYMERRGWKIKAITKEERGVLPIPMTSDYITNSAEGEALPVGVRGGYFHATTGFSLPDAVRFAEIISAVPEITTQKAREALMKQRRSWLSRQRFYRIVNRLIFYASEPSLRYQVMQKFYELPEETIERFYSGRTTWSDRIRILRAKPPLPMSRTLKSFTEKAVQARLGEEI